MKTYRLADLEDEIIGPKGTPERDAFELDVKAAVLGQKMKDIRKRKNMTQTQLGKLIGVKKAQISRLEKGETNMTLETFYKVFNALGATINIEFTFD